MRWLTTLAAFIALGISALAAPPVPRPAKQFDFALPAGKHVLLSSLKGKVVVVQGLLTYCTHCQAFSLMLNRLQKDYGPRGFQAMGIAFDDADAAKAQTYRTQFQLDFPVAYASRDVLVTLWGHSLQDRLAAPQIMVIDRKGVIQAQSAPEGTPELQQEPDLRAWIEKLLGPAKSGKAAPASSKPADSTKKPAS